MLRHKYKYEKVRKKMPEVWERSKKIRKKVS